MFSPVFSIQDISKKCGAFAIGLSILTPSAATADCNGLSTQLSALFELAMLTCEVTPDGEGWVADSCEVLADLDESQIPTSAIGVWNLIANGGAATIGPRPIHPGVRVDGRLEQPGTQIFILSEVADNEVTIDINYEDGRAGLELDVCTVNPDGDRERIETFVDPDDVHAGLTETVTLDHGAGVIFKLKPINGGILPRSYQYNFTVGLNNLPGTGPTPVTTLEPDTDRPGRDYRDFPIGNVTLQSSGKSGTATTGLSASTSPINARRVCRQACVDDPQCRAWTYEKSGANSLPHCWLKDAVPAAVSSSCCDSGVRN